MSEGGSRSYLLFRNAPAQKTLKNRFSYTSQSSYKLFFLSRLLLLVLSVSYLLMGKHSLFIGSSIGKKKTHFERGESWDVFVTGNT